MPAELLWIVKDYNSEHLSKSARSESSKIRQHVQVHRSQKLGRRSRNGSRQYPCVVHIVQDSDNHTHQYRDTSWTEVPVSLNLSRQSLTEGEARNLDFYVYRTAHEWTGWQDDYFWNILAIQACFLNPGITHALISIAAWHRLSPLPKSSEESTHLSQFRASQWQKAINSAYQTPLRDYSSALIQCVILICLQGHRGDYQDYRLLRSAKAMLDEACGLKNPWDLQTSASELDMINGVIRPLLERLEARRCTMGDLPASLLRSAEMRRFQRLARREIKPVPEVFTSLRHARDCLESILDWAHDQIPVFDDSPSDGSFFEHRLREQIRCWQTALCAYSSPEIYVERGIKLLKLAAIHGVVLLFTCTARIEVAFDAFIPDFREMVDILAELETKNDYRGRMSFGIDSGLINIVSLIGTRCRDAHLRQFAERWLHNSFRMEGDRPSLLCAHIIRAWMDLEYQNDDIQCCGDILESRRYRLLRGARYHAQGLIRLDFVAAPYDADAGAPVTQVWISPAHGRQDLAVSSSQLGMADVFIGSCNAAFLDDEKEGTYHNVPVTNFFFPIPRM